MELTIQVNTVERTVRFREVHALAAGDSCAVTLDGIRGADVPSLRMALYRDAASESPVASCPSFSPVQGHPNLATGALRLDTAEMASWFGAVRPESPAAAVDGSDQCQARPEDAAERAVRTDGWLVVSDSSRTWAACRVPVILRPGAGTSAVVDPTSLPALVEGLVSAAMLGALAGKADKVVPSTAGNLAVLDASGNLVDSGVPPASIDATLTREGVAADAKAVGDALRGGFTAWEFGGGTHFVSGPGLTTDNEWVYWLDDNSYVPSQGFVSEADALAASSLTFENADPVVTAIRRLVTPTRTSQLTNDSGFLTEQGVRGKLDGAAVYPAWQPGDSFDVGAIRSYNGRLYQLQDVLGAEDADIPPPDNLAFWGEVDVGALKQDALSPAQMAAVNSGATAAKVATWDGYAAQIAAKASASDVNTALAQKANVTDLPYALVVKTAWTYADLPAIWTVTSPPQFDGDHIWSMTCSNGTDNYLLLNADAPSDSDQILFAYDPQDETPVIEVTATRAYAYALADRAGNRVVVSGDTTLTLPAANPGHLRDFLVRLEISGSTVPTITFAAPTGETVTYETDGDEFPVPDEAGNWVYSFTENCVAHTFAVSLKKVNEVLQGGL